MANPAVNFAPVARAPRGKGPRTHKQQVRFEKRVIAAKYPGRVRPVSDDDIGRPKRRPAPRRYFEDDPRLWGPMIGAHHV